MHSFTELTTRGTLTLTGADRVSFLQGLVTNDVRQAPVYAALLTPQGKFRADFFVVPAPDALHLDTTAEAATRLPALLAPYRLRSDATLTDRSAGFATLALSAPPPPLTTAEVWADPRHPALGHRALMARDWLPDAKARLLATGFAEAGEEDYDLRRLTLGLPDGARDMVAERSLPLEYNLDALHAISWDKGCYLGQELTARTRYRARLRKRLLPVEVEGPLPPAGTPMWRGEVEAGELRSGRGTRALALLRLEEVAKSDVFTAAGATLKVCWPDFLDRSILTAS